MFVISSKKILYTYIHVDSIEKRPIMRVTRTRRCRRRGRKSRGQDGRAAAGLAWLATPGTPRTARCFPSGQHSITHSLITHSASTLLQHSFMQSASTLLLSLTHSLTQSLSNTHTLSFSLSHTHTLSRSTLGLSFVKRGVLSLGLTERLVVYCRTASASTAACTSSRMCCPRHCAAKG